MTGTFIVDVLVRAVGWAILHSVWQGAIIAGLTALLLRLFRGHSANLRYALACLGLAALTLSWVITGTGIGLQASRAASEDGASITALSQYIPSTQLTPATPVVQMPRPSMPLAAAWSARLETWSSSIVAIWLAGVLFLSGRLACGWFLVQRIRRAATEPIPAAWLARTREMAAHLAISRPIRAVQSATVHVPTVIGWLRPVVLLPASVFSGLTPEQLEAIIAHELAHIRRHDYAMNILQTAAEILLFYHPASWWISREVRVEREHCCDDIAVTACGSRYVYAQALADLETLRADGPAFGLAATDGPLMQRIRRLVAPASPVKGPSGALAVAAVPLTVLALVVMGGSVTGMQQPGTTATQTRTPTAPRTIPATEGAVTGQVVDARSSRPVANASVELLGPERAVTVVTGNDGRFEATGLTPARYRVWARAPGYAPNQYGYRDLGDRGVTLDVRGGQLTTGIDFRMQAVGALSGRVFNERGEGLAGVEMELVAEGLVPGSARPLGFAQTEQGGIYRFTDVLPGEYYVRAYVSDADTLKPGAGTAAEAALRSLERLRGRTSGEDAYGMTYYPSVTSVEQAQSLRVNSGQELFDIDFALATVKTHRITGTLSDPTGRPLGESEVMIHPMGPNRNGSERRARPDANGRFEILDVVPADYMLNVMERTAGPSRWVGASRFFTLDRDMLDLELKAAPNVPIEGRVVRDAGVTRALDPTAVRIGLVRRAGPAVMNLDYSAKADGTFTIQSLGAPASLQVLGLPPNWAVKSIRLDGVEIGNETIDLGSSGGRRIEVILTDRVSSVAGSVQDKDGRPLATYMVVIFPDDPKMWSNASRFVRETRTDQSGQFRIDGLDEGDYLAVGIESLPHMAWMDPEVLERLRPMATRLRLAEGQRATLSLQGVPALERIGPKLVDFSLKQMLASWFARLGW